VSKISNLTCAKPPTSSQETLGIFGAPIFWEYDDLALLRAASKSVAVKETPESLKFCSLLRLGILIGECEMTKRCDKEITVPVLCTHNPFDRDKVGTVNEIDKI
jgi:hypothetical protein